MENQKDKHVEIELETWVTLQDLIGVLGRGKGQVVSGYFPIASFYDYVYMQH